AVTVDHYLADDITLRTQAEGESFLVLAVTRCRGWTATIDGEPVPIHAVDGPLMGVRVPPGSHAVRFQFRPVLLWAGTAIACGVFAAVWSVVLVAVWRARRRVSASPATDPGISMRRAA